MAQRKKSEVEFIQDTFCPQVAVLCSYDAEVVCRKNSLTFVELVQPFCRFNGEIKITDPSNNIITISNLRVEIKDINAMPPSPLITKKLLDESVSNGLSSPQYFIEKPINLNNYNFIANVNTPWFESWRESFIKIGYPDDHEFLKHFLACIFVVSTSHLDPLDQFQKLIQQQQQPQLNVNRLPKWLFPNVQSVYKYFVLLHDVQEGEISKAHQIYENLKNVYGSSNCHLLQINSKPASAPQQQPQQQQTVEFDPWLQYSKFNDLFSNTANQYTQPQQMNDSLDQSIEESDSSSEDNLLTNNPLANGARTKSLTNGTATKRHGVCLALSDHDRIKTLINEFLQRGLVPYVERTIKILNEQIQSKKSILKSFGIPRRLFGGGSSSTSIKNSSSSTAVVTMSGLTGQTSSSPSSTSSLVNTNTTAFAGSNDDLQIRRLADLAFMFRLYDLAFTSYHTCKKEFTSIINNSSNQSNTEQLLNTTLYLAGALEMASISNFMQNFSSDSHHAALSQSASTSSIASIQSSPSTSSSSSIKSYNFAYIDEAIQLLLNTCKNTYFATRCALLSTEALKTINQFYKAAFQFISLASDDSDMRSALFLEQAAQCYLAIQNPQPSIRKYAFFMSIAGYRFNKAGQRKHAIRVYKHALDIYENRCWYKAQDHLNFVMSRLNFNLRNIPDALAHIENILVKKKLAQKSSSYQADSTSKQFTSMVEFSNETNILKDYILYSNTLINESKQVDSLPRVPVPLVDSSNLKINLYPGDIFKLRFGRILVHNDNNMDYLREPMSQKEKELLMSLNNASPLRKTTADSKDLSDLKEMWLKFEHSLYVSAYRTSVPILFKSHVTYFDQTTENKQMPKAALNEPLAVMFEIKNHLRINLIMSDVTLLWKFVSDESTNESFSNEVNKSLDHIAECSALKELNLTPHETYKLRLHIVPKQANGTLSILGIKYRLGLASFSANLTTSMMNMSTQLTTEDLSSNDLTSLYGKQLFEIKGARLNNNPVNMRSVVYEVDQRLNLKIINEMPLLQIELDHLPSRIQCDQLEKVRVYFVNLSAQKQIGNLKIASNGVASSRICFRQANKSETQLELNQMKHLDKSEFKFKETYAMSDQKPSMPTSLKTNIDAELVYSLGDVVIDPNDVYQLDMWIRGPSQPGEHKFYFMFFYQEVGDSSNTSSNAFKYRIIRYEFTLQTISSMTLNNLNIISSNASSNLLINIETSTHQPSVELIDSISVSDIWKTLPVNKAFQNFKTSSAISSSFEDIHSLTFKAEPIKTKENQVSMLRTQYANSSREKMPDEDVLFYFIKSDLKTQFLNTDSPKSSFLNVYFIWKLINKDEDDAVVSYTLSMVRVIDERIESYDLNKTNNNSNNKNNEQQLQPIRKFEYRVTATSTKFTPTEKLNLNIRNLLKNFLSVTSKCKSKIVNDFTVNKICQVVVSVELRNLSNTHNFDLIVLARNNLKKNLTETEKSYAWLGCNKRYIRLEANQSKHVKLKLGFYSNGVFEIGDQSTKIGIGDFKLNLFDSSSSSLNINTNSNVTIVLDDLNDTLTSVIDANNANSNNPILSGSNLQSVDSKSGCICIFNKNSFTNRYELFRCLNTFTVTII